MKSASVCCCVFSVDLRCELWVFFLFMSAGFAKGTNFEEEKARIHGKTNSEIAKVEIVSIGLSERLAKR